MSDIDIEPHVERVAKAIYAHAHKVGAWPDNGWESIGSIMREGFRMTARAALTEYVKGSAAQ